MPFDNCISNVCIKSDIAVSVLRGLQSSMYPVWASAIDLVARTIDSLDCDILSHFDNPSKSLRTPRGNNNGASSTEEQAINNASSKTDVHIAIFWWSLHKFPCLAMTSSSSRKVYTATVACDHNRASFKCADVDAQQIWQIRSGTDWVKGSWC
jgi:hypothetical protein